MDLPLIEKLLEIVKDSGVAEVEITEDDLKVVVRMQPPAQATTPPIAAWPPYAMPPAVPYAPSEAPADAPPAASAAADESKPEPACNGTTVKAPLVGTFYRAPGPDEAPFVNVGDVVSKGDALCIIEAMKLMNEVVSEVDGKVAEVLVGDALPVEFDQPLFLIET